MIKASRLNACWLLGLFFSLQAIGEQALNNPRKLTVEEQLPEFYHQVIQPFWQQHASLGEFKGKGDVAIRYATLIHPESEQLILVSPGRSEGYIKYLELAYDLYHQGYSVYIIDHRGQGLSGRMVSNPHKGYVEHFQDYVDDLKQFYDAQIAPLTGHKKYLLCHSMGGAIGLQYLLQHPDDFTKAVLSSPMLAFHSPFPLVVSKWLINTVDLLNHWLSDEPWYFLGQTDDLPIPYSLNTVTQSEVRYQLAINAYDRRPKAKLGGVTFHWLKESAAAIADLLDNADKITTPFLLLQSGNDKVVDNQGQDQLCSVTSACVGGKPVRIEHAYHELFVERDSYRIPALNHTLDFFQQSN